jgi:GNAT superfamily N-acetyltransferase
MPEIQGRYPRTDADGLELRLLNPSDEEALVGFFQRIPVDERQLFREDVTRPSVIRGWLRNLDLGRWMTLVAVREGRILAEATLHRNGGGRARHLGKLRFTVDPEVRGRGLARLLVQEFILLCGSLGVAILEAEVLDVQERAALILEDMGFQCVATLPQHAIDISGRVHDIRLYSQMIRLPEGLAPEAQVKEEDADLGGG